MDSFKRFLLVHLALGLCSAYLASARAIYEESPIPEAVLDLLADVELSNVTAVDSLLASCGVDLIPRPKATPAQQAVLKPVIFAREVGNALLGRQCTPTCNPGSSPSDTCNAVNSDCQPGVCCWNGNSGYCCGYGNECDIGGNTGCKWPTTTITVTATATSTYNQYRTFFTTLATTEYETETSSSTYWVTLSNVDTATLVQFITVSAQGARRLGRRTNRVHPSITNITPPAVHSTTLREFQNHAIENVKSLEGKQPIQTSSITQDSPKHTTLNAAQKLEKLELLRAKRATDTTVYTDTVTAGTTTRWVTSDSSFTSTISSTETSTYTTTTTLISTTVLDAKATIHLTSYFTQRPSASASTAGQDLPQNSQEPLPTNNNSGTSLSKGAQAGIAVGSASGSLIICIIIFFVCRRRRGRSKKDDQPPTTSMIDSGAAPAEKNYAAERYASVPSTGANSPPSTMEQPGLIHHNSYPSPSHRPPSPATSNSPNPNTAIIQDPRAWRGSGGSNEFANPVEAPERHLYGMQHPPTEMPGAAASFGGTVEQRQLVYAPHRLAPQGMRSPYELPGPEVDGRRGW